MAAGRASTVLSIFSKRNIICSSASYCQIRHLASGPLRTPGQWKLFSAVCLQRPPVISVEKTELEERYSKLMAQLELESSLLSNHELRALEDKAISEKKRTEESEEGEVEGARVTALDLEDAWEAEAKLFTPAPRVTEADKQKDYHSTERQLDQTLVLLVKQKLGDKEHWVFPQRPREQPESMRQAAERALTTNCGDSIKARFLGNAPCGFLQYRFPPSAGIGTGAKVFFFKAWYEDGDVVPNKEDTSDYIWVTMDELSDYCSKSYLQGISNFLVDL